MVLNSVNLTKESYKLGSTAFYTKIIQKSYYTIHVNKQSRAVYNND